MLGWIDEPCPYFDWHGRVEMHPEDREYLADRMAAELGHGTTSGCCACPPRTGLGTLHVTISKVELDGGVTGGLVIRLPTENELADVGLDAAGQPQVSAGPARP